MHPQAIDSICRLATAEESVEFLKKLLEIAREVVQADRDQVAEEGASAVADGGSDGTAPESLLPDQRVGALTQIFQEYKPDVTPEIVERIVHEIDAVVMGVRFAGWQTSREGDRTVKFEIRRAFKKYGLEPTGELFDRAYAYVAEHY